MPGTRRDLGAGGGGEGRFRNLYSSDLASIGVLDCPEPGDDILQIVAVIGFPRTVVGAMSSRNRSVN